MNERIRLLAEQAGFYYTDKTGFITPADCDPAKFAELIVLKCAEIAETAEPYQSADLIKQYFGNANDI